jgi:2-polyprenyl-3-methyl-5-hydroxy-6-metoxy-1,4-benzoquinol methylase
MQSRPAIAKADVMASVAQAEVRARLSCGTSNSAIYGMVARALSRRKIRGGNFVDVGCGAGALFRAVGNLFDHYVGVDVALYSGLPSEIDFCQSDLSSSRTPLPDSCGDVIACVETVEHLENPRALFRELDRLAKPRAWILVTTPNQLSLLSLATLVCKKHFNAFQLAHYPGHLTALLESDLKNMAAELQWQHAEIEYSSHGRIIFTPWHYPELVSRTLPRLCSDNILLIAKKPE